VAAKPVTGIALGTGPEFDRIRAIAAALGDARALGDDCAVVAVGDTSIVLSTDASVEGVHFRRDWLTLEEIGWRSAAAALSDLAAAGADCIGVLAAVTVPTSSNEGELVSLMRGVAAAAQAAGGTVLGGDLTRGPAWSAAITVVGRAARPVSRAGARAGDTLWLTGQLGGARAALTAWTAGQIPTAAHRKSFAHPEPRLCAGRWLARHGATAMLDLSDGLGADAGHLAAASAVRLEIDLALVPVAPGVEAAAAAAGGDDYELLVAMPAEFSADDASALARECDLPLTRIGRIREGTGVALLLDGAAVEIAGYDHFA
jgi:thiamine-monophosphate kinase